MFVFWCVLMADPGVSKPAGFVSERHQRKPRQHKRSHTEQNAHQNARQVAQQVAQPRLHTLHADANGMDPGPDTADTADPNGKYCQPCKFQPQYPG